jgi:hypothetical protein
MPTMDKVQKTFGSQYYTPSSEHFGIYVILWFKDEVKIFKHKYLFRK